MGAAPAAPMRMRFQRRPIGTRRDKDKDKDKKVVSEDDENKEQSIIPPDAQEIEGGEDQLPTDPQFGSMSDEQLEKLAGLIAAKLAPLIHKPEAKVPETKPEPPKPEATKPDENSRTGVGDPVANWLLGQRRASAARQEAAPVKTDGSPVFEAAVPTVPDLAAGSSAPVGESVLASGQPMPPPVQGTGQAFKAFCKFVKV
jgi:hypothetical protein